MTPTSVAREAEIGRDTIYRYPGALAYIRKVKNKSNISLEKNNNVEPSNINERYKILLQTNKQLSIDKLNLARENNRLQSENDDYKDRFQSFQREIDLLRTKLKQYEKIRRIK